MTLWSALKKIIAGMKKKRKSFGGIIKSCNFALAIKRDSEVKIKRKQWCVSSAG